MSEVNWGQLAKDAGDIQPVPVGKYLAIIVEATLKRSATSGNEYWAAKFRIQDGPQQGRTLFNNFVLVEGNPNALRAFFINMANLGITQDQLVALGPDKNALTPLLVGRQALVTVSHREWQGRMMDQIERIEGHPAGPIGNPGAIGSMAPGGGGGAPSPVPSAAPAAAPVAAPAPAPAAPAPAPAPAPAAAPAAPAPAPAAAAPAPAPVPEAAPAPAPAPTPEVAPPAADQVTPEANVPAALDPNLGQSAEQPAAPAAAPTAPPLPF